MSWVSSEGVCDNELCHHPSQAHDLNGDFKLTQPCTIDGCECADYTNHLESMIGFVDHTLEDAVEDWKRDNFRWGVNLQ